MGLSPYLIFLTVILATSVFECIQRNREHLVKTLFGIIVTLWLGALILRFGQGTDYFSYRRNYQWFVENQQTLGEFFRGRLSFDGIANIGYYFLNWIFASLHFPFEIFLSITAVAEVLLIFRFLKRYCVGFYCTSLAILFFQYYLTYQFSAIREGMVVSLFLGILLPLLEERRWGLYYAMVLVAFLIHPAAMILILCPLVFIVTPRVLEIMCVVSAVCGILIDRFGLLTYLGNLLSGVAIKALYLRINHISWFAYFLRLAICLVLAFLYHRRKHEKNDLESVAYKLVLEGASVYFILSTSAVMASRFFDIIRFVEIILIIGSLKRLESKKKLAVVLTALAAYLMIMTVKNLDAFIRQGYYNESVKAYNYPYITVFQKGKLDRWIDMDRFNDDYRVFLPGVE